MNSPVWGLRVAGTIFGVIAALHAARLLARLPVTVNGHALPLWPSALAALATGALCVWLWRLAGTAQR